MSDIPEINDPFVGKVYGNILDMYDNPSYNLRLFMVRKEVSNRLRQEEIFQSDQLIDPGTGDADQGEPVKNSDIVVLAQTGVTGTQIDNLEMQMLANPDNPRMTRLNFEIHQPGAASFLDHILLTKQYLGYTASSPSATMYLEIRFQGYQADTISENDGETSIKEGGDLATIVGPMRYKIQITGLSLNVDASGSVYQVSAVPITELPFGNTVYQIPLKLKTVGSTVREHLEYLETQLNKHELGKNENQDISDEEKIYEFDLSELLGTNQAGQKDGVYLTDDTLDLDQIEDTNRLMNADWKKESFEELYQARLENSQTSGTDPEEIDNNKALIVKRGLSIEKYLISLLSMCPEMLDKVDRRKNPDSPEVDKDQPYTYWAKIEAEAQELREDPVTGEMKYKYIYKPILYKSVRVDVLADKSEAKLSEENKEVRTKSYLEDKRLLKAYNYLFTGLNDQVLELDLQYDHGLTLLVPYKGGSQGDFSTNAGKTQEATVDPKHEGQTGIESSPDVVRDGEGRLLGSSLETVVGLGTPEDVEEVSGTIAAVIDKDPVAVSNAINDDANSYARELSRSLDLATLRELNQIINVQETTVITEAIQNPGDPESENPDGSSYTPEQSGYNYAADLFREDKNLPQNVTVDNLLDLGYISVKNTGDIQQQTEEHDLPVDDSAASGIASPKSKLFSMYAWQRAQELFLITVNINLRGDPWYLGAYGLDGESDSNQDRANFRRHDNLFWLRFAAPIVYDPDYTDEDSDFNSGYWRYDGTSYTFSGLYRMITVTNRFSAGMFTTEVKANKIFGLTNSYEEGVGRKQQEQEETDTGDDS